ncbi:PREDICTED: putative nuclease HARBI1 [Vollenhovia emeryi]|uniref:putative nuclease HARBI1 n=1 Tax=Vollenhovia emeryi TaxID=411798 RepID=UPI0005F51944|nr:PREDICTED: putative nuclease HARBI1 [Vollenhovia emeryi]
MPVYVQWPNTAQCDLSCNIFDTRSRRFKGVIGAIDGCHIPCKQPVGNANDYYNRKGFHSIVLQGVCDHKGQFIDCYIGMPGRMHDARVFRNSPLFNAIGNGLIPENRHIIGDSAYPLLRNLMTPFKDNGHLTHLQLTYNTKLNSIRSIIERAFGLLKSKFRRLKYLDISNLDLGNHVIAAACVLYNFILNRDGFMMEDEVVMDNEYIEDEVQVDIIDEDVEAVEKRMNIARNL